jgi:hypothetical protein
VIWKSCLWTKEHRLRWAGDSVDLASDDRIGGSRGEASDSEGEWRHRQVLDGDLFEG